MERKKEEERNEKIIRGVMKLPPNRRCINCNCQGPQYVCTNFWTFICITCSGIHREFTHRVKSVSMAKFSSQEVEALQKGGNQRAREIFLKDLDFQNWRLPDCSNVNKIREFIKSVYVDKKYTGGKISEQPMQGIKEHEEKTTKASSYHSYSQSPPYDYQYETRKYGKNDSILTRNPGSDRGFYKGNISNFLYSPGRSSVQSCDDRFGNDGSVGRASDFSVSSSGDLYNHGTQCPNIQDHRSNNFSSHNFGYISNNGTLCQSLNLFSDAPMEKNSNVIPPLQGTSSFGGSGSVDGSANFADYKSAKFIASSHGSKSSDVSHLQRLSSNINSESSSVDLFQPSANGLNLFQTSQTQLSSKESANFYESGQFFSELDPVKCSTSAIDANACVAPKQFDTCSDSSTERPVIGTEGWATFDAPPPSPTLGNHAAPSFVPASIPSLNLSWSAVDLYTSNGLKDNHTDCQNIAFDLSTSNGLDDEHKACQSMERIIKLDEAQQVGYGTSGVPSLIGQSPFVRSSLTTFAFPFSDGGNQHCDKPMSKNPFDVAYDLDDSSNMFDMNHIHRALSDSLPQSQFNGDGTPTWFPIHSVSSHGCPHDGSFNGGKNPNIHLSDSWNGGKMASIGGGNPFI